MHPSSRRPSKIPLCQSVETNLRRLLPPSGRRAARVTDTTRWRQLCTVHDFCIHVHNALCAPFVRWLCTDMSAGTHACTCARQPQRAHRWCMRAWIAHTRGVQAECITFFDYARVRGLQPFRPHAKMCTGCTWAIGSALTCAERRLLSNLLGKCSTC